jgi:hypothetical protein
MLPRAQGPSPSPGQIDAPSPGTRSPVLAELVSRARERRSKSNYDRPAHRQMNEDLIGTHLHFEEETETEPEAASPRPHGLHLAPAIRPANDPSAVHLLQVSPVMALEASVARAPRNKATPA